MAVEKMCFMNIAGPIDEIDHYVLNYIVPYEIQLERTASVVNPIENLVPFNTENVYDQLLKDITTLCKEMNIQPTTMDNVVLKSKGFKELKDETLRISQQFEIINERKKELASQRDHKAHIKKQISLIQGIEVEVDKFFEFKYMKFRFGKMPKESFEKINEYQEHLDVIIHEVFRENGDVFVICFMPRMVQEEIDMLLSSLYFTRIRLSGEIKGYPKDALVTIEAELDQINREMKYLEQKSVDFINKHRSTVLQLYNEISLLDTVTTVRQYAMHTKEVFYLSGWIPKSHVDDFIKSMKHSTAYSFEVEEDGIIEKKIMPPTKLKNNRFFRPFESFVKMYATPSYTEMDPTVYVGIVYILMFAIMFGDIGQGLVIALIGCVLYKKSKQELWNIMIYLGIASMISGVFYGSIFGNEHFMREHFSFIPMINPLESINTILIFAIGLGIFLIISSMIFNIINTIKSKNKGKLLFDKNGIIGMVFYFAILFLVLDVFLEWGISFIPDIVVIIASTLIIFMSHPLQKWIQGQKEIIPSKDKVGFFVESFFELVEIILSIASNTISFVRVGAFALNHVGFFLAFKMLSDMVNEATSATGGIIVMILGNVLIIALEGLIVGIQGLRLVYYELFSRFFDGNGKEFKPFIPIKRYNNR